MQHTRAVTTIPRTHKDCAVEIYPHGTITDRGSLDKLTSSTRTTPRAKRSEITTFSRHSAARLRKLLVRAKGPEGWNCFGVTLTLPGPPITGVEWRRLWRAYVQRLRRLKAVLMIWRIEKQKRGQPHIHGICWGTETQGCVGEKWMDSLQGLIREHWMDVIGLLGPCSGPTNVIDPGEDISDDNEVARYGSGFAEVTHRKMWPGAEERAVKFDGLGKAGHVGWWRYLASHTSKSKQSQLGWQGRQWGVVNKEFLDFEKPISIVLSQEAIIKVTRGLCRATGCKYASTHGVQPWFNNPAITLRLCEWVTGICQPLRLAARESFSPFKLWKKDKREKAKAKRRKLLGVPI